MISSISSLANKLATCQNKENSQVLTFHIDDRRRIFCWQTDVALSESHGHLRFLRRERCWGTPGKLRPWSPGQWRWRWFPCPEHQPFGTGTSGLPAGWTHCTTCQITRLGSVFQEIQTHLKQQKFSSRINEHYESEHGFDDLIYVSHIQSYWNLWQHWFLYSVVLLYIPVTSLTSPFTAIMWMKQLISCCGLSLSFNIILQVEYNTFWFYIKWLLPFLLYFTSSTGRGWENTQKKISNTSQLYQLLWTLVMFF